MVWTRTTITLIGPKTVAHDDDARTWHHDLWRIKIEYKSNSAVFDYRTGTGLRDSSGSAVRPSDWSVLYALASDYRAYDECSDVTEYAENYGMFPIESADDLRDLVRGFDSLKEQAMKLRSLFGSDLAEFLADYEDDEEPES